MLKNKRIFFILFHFLYVIAAVSAQELKIDFPKGKIIIDGAANLNVEGYDGTQVLITEYYEQNSPELEKGLTEINSLKQSKALDLAYKINGDELKLTDFGKSGRYIIKVPKQLNVSCTTKTNGEYYNHDGLKILNFNHIEGEIEVNARGGVNVHIKNGTAPISVVTYGNITAEMKSIPQNGVLSFDTYLGYVNLSIPERAAATFSLSAKKGAIYTNLPLNKKDNKKNLKKVNATLNGGGLDILVNAEAGGDIYIRK